MAVSTSNLKTASDCLASQGFKSIDLGLVSTNREFALLLIESLKEAKAAMLKEGPNMHLLTVPRSLLSYILGAANSVANGSIELMPSDVAQKILDFQQQIYKIHENIPVHPDQKDKLFKEVDKATNSAMKVFDKLNEALERLGKYS